jgi:MFS family permease
MTSPQAARVPWRDLGALCIAVFLEFLAMGLPLAVLPLRVHDTLGSSAFVVGLVVGAASIVTLLTRYPAGIWSDRRGPRLAVLVGLGISSMAGLAYALSAQIADPTASIAVLLAGRGLLGLGESLVIVGALAWGVALAGRTRAGLVMAWVGIAMYGALAMGAPLGAGIEARWGFATLGLAAAAAPLAAMVATLVVRAVAVVPGPAASLRHLARQLWLPGTGLALCALSFAAIAGFSALLFTERGWSDPALPAAAFGTAYVLSRILFGSLPDRLGGARVAMASVGLAAVGQVGMWLAPDAAVAIAAAALTGLGFSLAFPAFGVEAMRPIPPQSRGVALGIYVAFFDATMGFGIPLLGAAVASFGIASAFGLGAVGAVLSLVVAARLAAGSRSTWSIAATPEGAR